MDTALLTYRQTFVILLSSLVVLAIAGDAMGMTYYVSSTGSDSNDGFSRSTAWQTIQHAADRLNPGDEAIVTAGNYNERVTVTRSGTSGQVISLAADSGATVTLQGFEIMASYTQETGFDISNNHQAPQHGFGIYLIGSNNVLSYNRVHDVCFEGIYLSGNGNRSSPDTANNLISYNTVARAEMSAITVEGQDKFNRIQQFEPDISIPPNCPRNRGADAVEIRFFGSGHTFKGNVITNIAIPGSQYNPDPHTDCF